MGIGTFVRHRMGRLEIPAARAYRRLFINLTKLSNHVAATVPNVKQILEVGCSDGAFGQELVRVYPEADYLGIDIAPTAGRLYRGDPARARFETITVQDLLAEQPQPYDLVVLVDVVHHVPLPIRTEVLRSCADLVRPGGHLLVKDWARNRMPRHYLANFADKYITGDKGVEFWTLEQLRELVNALEGYGPTTEWHVPPVRNNVLFTRQRLDASARRSQA